VHDSGWKKSLFAAAVPWLLAFKASQQGIGKLKPEDLWRQIAEHMEALSLTLENKDFLCGDALSAADIAVYAQMECICRTARGESTMKLPKAASFRRWFHRVKKATNDTTTADSDF